MSNLLKNIYYLTLCHLFPSKINSGAYGAEFTMGFRLEKDNRWYADIPHWPGLHAQLEMVAGAADMLDAFDEAYNKQGYVKMHVSLNPFENCGEMTKIHETEHGATYQVKSDIYNKQAWLCNVSKWVFGQHPEKIYFEMV